MKEQAGRILSAGRATGTAPGSCWTTAVWWSTCSRRGPEFYSLERLWHDGKPVDLSGVLTEN